MAEDRKKNIIIKGLPEGDRHNDDQMEVEEMLKFLFCKHRITQIKNGGVVRLGGRSMGKKRFLMVSFDNETAANQIYSRRNLLEDHPYMHNVYIMRDLPRSERRNRRVSNMLNEASQSGRRMHTDDPETTPSNSNGRLTAQNVNNASEGGTTSQNRSATDSLEDISGERNSLGDGGNTSIQPSVNTNITRDIESPSGDEGPLNINILENEGASETQQTEDTNGERGNLITVGQMLENGAGGTTEESNNSGNEVVGGQEGGS